VSGLASNDETLWELTILVDRWRQSKRDLERGEAIFAECWSECPMDNHPPALRSDGGMGYDYAQCPVHGPELDELNRRALEELARQKWESR
jgi:hypothetical protein